MPFLYVFIGGGLGSLARFGIAKLLQKYDFNFPWATFIANLCACILLGSFIAYTSKAQVLPDNILKYMFMTGFCGGFSTFSTFTAETFFLFQEGKIPLAIFNILGSLLVCGIGLYIGMKLIR